MTPYTSENRARTTRGISSQPIYDLVTRLVGQLHPGGGLLLDVGCGMGLIWDCLAERFAHYVGVDIAAYDGFPLQGRFHAVDLNEEPVPLPDACAEVVLALGTIECLENPRAFLRELTRLTAPDGLILVTTSNQLSLLSKITLLLRNQFSAIRDGSHCPALITALLEVDLVRMAREMGLVDIAVHYTDEGRIPFTPWHWPRWLGFRGRAFSDGVLLAARRPHGAAAGPEGNHLLQFGKPDSSEPRPSSKGPFTLLPNGRNTGGPSLFRAAVREEDESYRTKPVYPLV